MEYKIAIPSYKRWNNFIVKDLLTNAGIPPEKVFIFVSNKEEFELYKTHHPEYNIIFEKELNDLKEKHNFIVDYFNEGEFILCIEDDIKDIVKKKGPSRAYPFHKLDELIKIGFAECIKNSCKLWGISPTDNGFYMKHQHSKCFKVIAGYFFGMIIDKRIKVNIATKHDFERTIINQILFDGVIRFDGFGQKSASFKNTGGLQEQFSTKHKRMLEELKTNHYLLTNYPEYVSKNHRTNKVFDQPTELRLIKKKKNK